MRSSTNRLQTPASITAWILSFGPSDRYESAQHASAKTSESAWNSRRESTGRHGHTFENSGGGFFPRHRFDRAHTAFRVIERRVALLRSLKIIQINGYFMQNSLTIQLNYSQMHKNKSNYRYNYWKQFKIRPLISFIYLIRVMSGWHCTKYQIKLWL